MDFKPLNTHVLGSIFEPKKDEISEQFRILRNEKGSVYTDCLISRDSKILRASLDNGCRKERQKNA